MKNFLILLIASMFIMGCGSSKDNEVADRFEGVQKLIVDSDNLTDQDDMGAIGMAVALMQEDEVNIIGIALAGIDTFNARSLGVSAITHYYNFPNIPISTTYDINTRTQPNKWSYAYPPLSEYYKGTARDIREFETDGLYDNQREETTAMYCRLLQENTDVTIVVLGQTYSISNLIRETDRCNGKELIKNSVKRLVIVGGGIDQQWDMNTGSHHPFLYYTSASTKLTYATMTELGVQIVNTTANRMHDPVARVGTIYQTANTHSPMAFAFSTNYGSRINIEHDSWTSDFRAIAYIARPDMFELVTAGSAEWSKYASMTWNYSGQGSSDYNKVKVSARELQDYLNSIMSIEPTR